MILKTWNKKKIHNIHQFISKFNNCPAVEGCYTWEAKPWLLCLTKTSKCATSKVLLGVVGSDLYLTVSTTISYENWLIMKKNKTKQNKTVKERGREK